MNNQTHLTSIIFALFLALCIAACHTDKQTGAVYTVDLNEGLKTEREFRLSEVVKDVEYIPLETTKESLFSSAGYILTDNHILVYQWRNPCRLLLFDRSGKFIRQIGHEGKGPGEYISMNHVYPDPSEEWMIIYDYQAKRVLKYGFDGTLLSEFDASEKISGSISSMVFIEGERIAVKRSRPTSHADHYPLIQIFDYDFNLLQEKFFVYTEDLNASGWGSIGSTFYYQDKKLHIREFFYDTLFVETEEEFKPQFYFKIEGERPPGHYITFGAQGGGFSVFSYSALLSSQPLGNLQLLTVVPKPLSMEEDWFYNFMIFNPKTKDLFALKTVPVCSDEPEAVDRPGILNDMDGYMNLTAFNQTDGYLFRSLEMLDLYRWMDDGCAMGQEVRLPKKRDELTRIIKSRSIEDNPVIQVFKLK